MLVYVSWDVEQYVQNITRAMTGTNKAQEARLSNRYPPVVPNHCVHISGNPTTIVDGMGRILTWVIPEALSAPRQVSVYD